MQQLGLEKAGVQFSNKGIAVNEHMQTNVSHIYATGDVIGGIQLAHVAFHEGTTAITRKRRRRESKLSRCAPLYIHSSK